MSLKKDLKIKKLRRKALLPRILSIIFVDILLISAALFFGVIATLHIFSDALADNYKSCNAVVELVNDNYQIDDDALFKAVTEFERLSAYVEQVYLTDDDFNVINSFDNEEISFQKEFSVKEAKKRLAEDGLFRNELDDYEVMFGDFINFDFSFLNVESFLFKRDMLDSATEAITVPSSWLVLRSSLGNVNVCIKTNYPVYPATYSVLFLMAISIVCVVIFTGIYELRKIVMFIVENRKVQKLVFTDTVTGGNNKEYFIRKSSKYIKRNPCYVLVQLRLEKYRNYCTAYGVKEGENLLEDLYNALDGALVKKEIAAHLEKADFALLLVSDADGKIEERVSSILEMLGNVRQNQHLLFSVGICRVEARHDDVQSLLTAAGLAITKRTESANNIVWFDASMKEEQVWERHIEDDMEKALENHEFKVYLQPKYSTKEEVLSAAEALVRWVHPELGFISPGKFIPIFERNGFILKLDDYMLDEVAKQQAKWREEGKKLVPISVNVSRAHFARYDLAEHICSIVDSYKVPHEFIELELTESAFFDDKTMLLETVKKLKSFGFKVSMDDFGAGYSSLNSLKELPLDIIKLDAEFFRGADDLERSNLIVGDTISLAKKLGMQIVAEGIETREQVDFLAKQNCDLIQGFYFAKPLPINEFEERAYGTN